MTDKKPESEKEILSPKRRAEDILLGSLGFGEDSRIVSVELTASGYRGMGAWSDGENFEFECSDELDHLQKWALELLLANK